MDIYVGNLSLDATRDELIEIFEKFGQVIEVRLLMDKFGVKSKRYAFIEMPSEDDARKAIEEMNGKEFKERALSVSVAKPKKTRVRKARGGKRKNRGKGRRTVYGGEGRDDSVNIRRRHRGR
ncbi:MAG TPA: RNA-binding protein [Sedimentisphaerales bacterium]|nr:RNA-binding protein [Sedimentisphaerales bacterium]